MSSIDYKTIYKDRLNPQFIGIAQKFNSVKKNRLSLEHERNNLKNNLIYKVKVDNSLQNKLYQNRVKLMNVKEIHQRRLSDIQYKRQRSQQYQARLMELYKTAKQSRQQTKYNIRTAIMKNHAGKTKKRQMVHKMLETFNHQLNQSRQLFHQQNQIKYKEIKSDFLEGKRTVNNFYKKKNLESLNNYKTMIEHEVSLTKTYKDEIKNIQESIDTYDNKIDRKKKYMYEILDQISHFTHEPLQVQSRCLPLYLRQNTLNTSYHSSKPSDIILNGYKRILNKQSLTTDIK